MPAPLSHDLRLRVIRALEAGPSRTAAAQRVGLGAATAMRGRRLDLQTGRTHATPCGGDRRSARLEAHADWLKEALRDTPDLPWAELRPRLIDERGESVALSTLHACFQRHGVTFKHKRRPRMNPPEPTSRRHATPGAP